MPIFDDWVLPASGQEGDASLPVDSRVVRQLFARRGIDSGGFELFTRPSVADLHDASLIHGLPEACERIARAIRDRARILIYGDYDVDGVTSIVLLRTVLSSLGAEVDYVVPHRLVDGYGLKIEVLDRVLRDRAVSLVITVDCGITSVEPVKLALDRGIDVIITDHHLPPEALPAAAAVLNPRQPGCEYPFKELAGAGVAFKLCCGLLARSEKKVSIASLLKLAALGTIADVAPLVGENRTIAKLGLEGLSESRNRGLAALLRATGLSGSRVRSTDVGFKIGPRINAAGRLASADTAIRLFEAATDEEAFQLALELETLNTRRQGVEREVLQGFEEMIAAEPVAGRAFVVAREGWHRGVLGLCAGRIAQKYYKPTLLMSTEGEMCVGSGRSVPAVDLHSILASCSELFTHFGGHSHACGFALPLERLPELRAHVNASLDRLPAESLGRRLQFDAEASIEELISPTTLAEYELLEPFGASNPQPVFLVRGVKATRTERTAHGATLSLTSGGETVRGQLWEPSLVALFEQGEWLDIAVGLELSRREPFTVRLVVRDAARAGEAPVRNETPVSSVS